MNFLQVIYPGDSLASFLIRVLAEITLVTLVALVFGRVAVRNNPALRHGVCVCALLCVLIAPITTLGLQRMGWRTLQISLESEQSLPVLDSTQNDERSTLARMQPAHGFWTLERARDAASATILIWLTGSGYLVFGLIGGMRKVKRIRMSAYNIDHTKLKQALDLLSNREKQPAVPVKFSQKINSPIVVGPRQTTVILPAKLLDQLNVQQLRCVLAHELTHVRQRDPLIGLIQRIVEAGYWPHPFVHLLNRDLVRAREEVCDNVALHGTTAPQYADTLLTVALGIAPRRTASPGAVGLMAPPWKLEERVKGLLDPHRRLTTTMNTRHLAFMAIALASGIAVIAGARVVAAPNPPTLHQQVVELHSSYNTKTHKIDVTAKSHKIVVTQSKRVVRVVSKPSRKASTAVTLYSVEPTQTYTLKSSDLVDLRAADPVRVRKVAISSKPANPGANVLSLETTQATTPVVVQETVHVEKLDPTATRVFATVVNGNSTLKSDATDKTTSVTIAQPGDVKSVTSTDTFVATKGQNGNDALTQIKSDDNVGSAAKVQVYELKGTTDSEMQGQIYAVTSKDGKNNAVQVTPWPKANGFVLRQDGKTKVEWSSKDVFKANPFKFQPEMLYRLHSEPTDTGSWTYGAPKHKPTTIYIKGADIKIVGDDIKVVYLKPETSKQKANTKPGNSKPKPK